MYLSTKKPKLNSALHYGYFYYKEIAMLGKTNGKEEKVNAVNFLEEHAGDGIQDVDVNDLVMPFLRIAQKGSPQVDKDAPEHIQGLVPGMFFNTLTNRVYGKEIEVVPVFFKKMWMEWQPNRGGLVGRHEPHTIEIDKSEFGKWKTMDGSGNSVQETFFFYCMIIGAMEEGPILLALSSTGIKHAKTWNTQILMTRLKSGKRAPYYSSTWLLKTVVNQNEHGTWYQLGGKKTMIERKRFITKKEFVDYIEPIREGLKTAQIDYSQMEQIEQTSSGETVDVDEF